MFALVPRRLRSESELTRGFRTSVGPLSSGKGPTKSNPLPVLLSLGVVKSLQPSGNLKPSVHPVGEGDLVPKTSQIIGTHIHAASPS